MTIPTQRNTATGTFREKALRFVRKAEQWQAIVDSHEIVAEAKAKSMLTLDEQQTQLLHLRTEQELESDRVYKSAVANRNANQTQAVMYALMALLEGNQNG